MKNKILITFSIGTLLLVLIRSELFVGYIFDNFRRSVLANSLEIVHNILLLFPIALFFCVITYKMPERIFAAWWKFARVAFPVILLLTILINLKLHHSSGGWINTDADVDRVALALMYAIFVLGSIVQIVRAVFKK